MEDVVRQIAREVGECNGKLSGLCDRFDGLCERVERHEYSLHGNGTPGLKVRVDRVEQAAKSRKAIVASVVSVLGMIGTAVISWLKGTP